MKVRRHTRKRGGESTGIDLAPMLDFVMNLLIFFIITAVFAKESPSGTPIANCFVTYTPAPAANEAPQVVATTGGC